MIGKAIVGVLVAAGLASAGGTTCVSRYDRQFDRIVTDCRDGSRAISRYDKPFDRWRTEVVRPRKAGPHAGKHREGKR